MYPQNKDKEIKGKEMYPQARQIKKKRKKRKKKKKETV